MVRITVISGFLGAGKTTFSNLLLDYYIRAGEKTAYVVNEFGEVGLDSALLKRQGFDTVDIVGGCICCTLHGKIKEALRDLVKKFSPDRIVFEPSGIFIFEKFLSVLEDEYLKEHCEVDSVITIVDSTHLKDAMFVPGNFFANQVAHADTIVMSKIQLYEGNARALEKRMRGLNERADILAKPWSELSDRDFASLYYGGSIGVTADEDDDGHEHEHDHGHEHEEHDHKHSHHPDFDTITIQPKEYDDNILRELENLLRKGEFGEVYRIKGKVICGGKIKVLQAVFDTVRLDELGESSSGSQDIECALAFIGHDLDEAKIREYWAR
ncbi:hypothetical protein FACS1894216_09740 [Synergistales bacterium]|nr:hypothetical protein FACS1894216_09740 [Synergistales bacterium]